MKAWLAAGCLALFAVPAGAAPDLRFAIAEGRIENLLFRDGPVAAHAVLKSGPAARLVVAFPAGNSGAGLWFAETVQWRAIEPVKAAQKRLPDASVRRGIALELAADAPSLTVRRALVGSVRVLRDHGYGNPIPPEVEAAPVVAGSKVTWERRRLDGAPGYALEVKVLNGTVAMRDGAVVLTSRSGPLRLKVTALTSEEPLTPLTMDEIFNRPDGNSRLQQSLAFLSYREKLLAGSWQYDTYFGRDTLMTLALLHDALRSAPVEAGLAAVLERLDPKGEVAHEEDIGEFALIGRPGHDARHPVLDYKMVDDDFMLAPVLATYLLDSPEGRPRAAAFLARKTSSGVSYGELALRNLAFVAAQARPFAENPAFANLVALHKGLTVGDWRDSQDGLGGDGRYSFSVNAALVPAALDAGARLMASGLLDGYGAPQAGGEDFAAMARVWHREAPGLFLVAVPADEAHGRLAGFAQAQGVALPAGGPDGEVRYFALALDAKGQPVKVMHSDVGFLLFFARPDDAALQAALGQTMRPFPAGLMSDAGLLVANPALADAARWPTFDNTRYHGMVVWSWQQRLLQAGISCQLARTDISDESRAMLARADAALMGAIARTRPLQASELWSWRLEQGLLVPQPYGQATGHETESNAVQLWSAAGLAQARSGCGFN